jgi:hypothetical protein
MNFRKSSSPVFALTLAFLCAAPIASAQDKQPNIIPPGYTVETIAPPEGVNFGVGGIDIAADGTVYAGTRYGQVWRYKDARWSLFAEGLHEITGLSIDRKSGRVFVMQKPGLTELISEDSTGPATRFRVVTEAFGYSGNYHEYAYGPVIDSKGNFYGTLNLGHGGGTSVLGSTMSIAVEGRGTCFKVTPDGKYSTYSWGLRSPAGIGINPANDELFFTDNQGDWNASSSLHHIKENRFHGHPASLKFHPDFKGKDLNKITPEEYAKLRTPPAVWIPHGEIANSPGNPLFDTTGGKFGPFAGQMFIGDQSRSTVFRILLDKVGDDYQGAVVMMVDCLQSGALRLAFAPDGSMWVGETSRGWGSAGGAPFGVQRIVWDGKTVPFEIANVKLETDGFTVSFTKPIAAGVEDPGKFDLRHWGYLYQAAYGSPKVEEKQVKASSVKLSADKLSLKLTLPELVEGRVYKITMPGELKAAAGEGITNRSLYYTFNRRR